VPLSSLLIIIVPLVALVMGIIATRAMPLFRSMQKRTDRVQQVMRETLSGMRVIRAFVRTDHDEARYDVANRDLTDTALRTNRLFAMMIPFLFGIMNLSTVAIVWFGGLRIDSGGMPIGNLSAFLQIRHADPHVGDDGGAHCSSWSRERGLRRTDPAGSSDSEAELCDPDEPFELTDPIGLVEFDNVQFGYPGARGTGWLCDISFTAKPGQTTAIVGSTGAGQDDRLSNLNPARLRRDLRPRADRRRRRPSDAPGDPLAADGHGSAEGLPISAAPSPATFATATRTPPTTSSGRPWK